MAFTGVIDPAYDSFASIIIHPDDTIHTHLDTIHHFLATHEGFTLIEEDCQDYFEDTLSNTHQLYKEMMETVVPYEFCIKYYQVARQVGSITHMGCIAVSHSVTQYDQVFNIYTLDFKEL